MIYYFMFTTRPFLKKTVFIGICRRFFRKRKEKCHLCRARNGKLLILFYTWKWTTLVCFYKLTLIYSWRGHKVPAASDCYNLCQTRFLKICDVPKFCFGLWWKKIIEKIVLCRRSCISYLIRFCVRTLQLCQISSHKHK